MADLDPRIKAVADKYGLERGDFWELPQKKGTWVAKHSALEVAAAKAGILFDDPRVIEAATEAGIAVISVAGQMGDRREWATGEASPKNNRNAYPWAMAEKRAKDRVILKLIGIHGLVYSEDEGDFTDKPGDPVATEPKAKTRDLYSEMQAELDACSTLDELAGLWRSTAFKDEFAKLKPDWREQLTERKETLKAQLSIPAATRASLDRLENAQ